LSLGDNPVNNAGRKSGIENSSSFPHYYSQFKVKGDKKKAVTLEPSFLLKRSENKREGNRIWNGKA